MGRLLFLTFVFFIVMFSLQSVVSAKTDSIVVSKDPSFSNPTRNVSAADTIYVKVTSGGSGAKKATLSLLTGEGRVLKTVQLSKISENPFIFTTSLTVPSESGVYQLDGRVEDDQSSFAGVISITVGQGGNVSTSNKSSSTKIETNQKAQTVTGGQINVVNLSSNNSNKDSGEATSSSSSSPSLQKPSSSSRENSFNFFPFVLKLFANIVNSLFNLLVFQAKFFYQ